MATQQGLTQKIEQKQRQLMIQRQLGSMVEKNTVELEEEVRKELDDNPALEQVVNPDNTENITEDGREFKETSRELQKNDEFAEDELPQRRNAAAVNKTESTRYEPVIVNDETLMEHLMTQLNEQELSDQDQLIARHIIGNIDSNGYLRRSSRAIADDVTFKEGIMVETEDVEKILERIKLLDPPGIAAKDLQECLMIQLQRKKDTTSQLALKIIQDYFQLLTSHNYARMRTALDIDEQQMMEAERAIRRLDPKPGTPYTSSMEEVHGQQITPDFMIDEDLSLSLCNNIPELQISQSYSQLLLSYEKQKPITTSDKGQQRVIKQKVDKARSYIDLLEQRQKTLFRIMQAIMVRQKEYFNNQGDELTLKPMILRDISEDTGIDVSVISRATNNKYVQTPWGLKSLKSFFSEGLKQTDADGREVEVATLAIKKALQKLVESENPNEPYSDDRLCALLRQQGFQIARRTVAKYRDQLMIEPAVKRRKRNQR